MRPCPPAIRARAESRRPPGGEEGRWSSLGGVRTVAPAGKLPERRRNFLGVWQWQGPAVPVLLDGNAAATTSSCPDNFAGSVRPFRPRGRVSETATTPGCGVRRALNFQRTISGVFRLSSGYSLIGFCHLNSAVSSNWQTRSQLECRLRQSSEPFGETCNTIEII